MGFIVRIKWKEIDQQGKLVDKEETKEFSFDDYNGRKNFIEEKLNKYPDAIYTTYKAMSKWGI